MLRHYIIIAWRKIVRNRLYSFLLTAGLALGIASSTLLGLYVWHELTVDRFHENSSRTYLVAPAYKEGTDEGVEGSTAPPVGPAIAAHFPEVESYTRLCTWFDDVVVTHGDRKFVETGILGADSTVFDVFTIPFVSGNPATALRDPNSIVITESFAKKYFGDTNPIGQTLKFDHFFYECQITGVVKDYPDNSHFDFDVLLSMSSLNTIHFDFNNWLNHTFSTYVVLNEKADLDAVTAKLPEFTQQSLEPYLVKRFQKSYSEMYGNGGYYRFTLVPLAEIHLSTLLEQNQEGKKLLVYAMGAIGVIILILVCINYVNLATVLSLGRAREAGVRKVTGGGSRSLFRQFMVESTVIALIGMIFGIGLIELATPLFNSLTGLALHLDYQSPLTIGMIVFFALLIGGASGVIPATTFASVSPVRSLKGAAIGSGKSTMRNVLIVFQFTICVLMLSSTVVVYNQLSFMTNRDTGFEKEQVLVIHRPEGLKTQKTPFKNELLTLPGVSSVSYTETIPGRHFNGHGQHIAGTPQSEIKTIYPLVADKDIFETLGLEIIRGVDFSEMDPSRPKAVLNEAAVRELQVSEAVGVKIDRGTLGDQEVDVVGVAKDFHFMSFHHQVEPLVIYQLDVDNDPRHLTSFVLVRMLGTDVQGTISEIEARWKKYAGNYPFDYSFMDDDFNRLFEREMRMAKVYTVFSVISIAIACLGLIGLISWFTERRSKEVSIRKIVGATMGNIVLLLSRDFLRLLLISVVAGSAIAWYLMSHWMESFAYRAGVSVWIFVGAGVATLIVAIGAVGWNLYRAASRNPVDTLKTE